jgi:hypothetical protein
MQRGRKGVFTDNLVVGMRNEAVGEATKACQWAMRSGRGEGLHEGGRV